MVPEANSVIEISDICSHRKNNLDYLDFNKIEEIEYDDLTYTDFFEKYMMKNIPCIVKNITHNWKCNNLWIHKNTLCYEYLKNQYGDLQAPVADCDEIEFNAHCKSDWNVSKYMDYLESETKSKTYYLKDWHLKKLQPKDNFYEVPHIFASDWLNEYALDNNKDDFMFVYIGPNLSWTPLHVDVYNSYSWSSNIVGKKKWILFYPGEETKLKDSFGNLPLQYQHKKCENIKSIEIIQNQGDAIFVPSGWHHQVQNLENTISINHNWINGCNIEAVWKALQTNLDSVIKEIREFEGTSDFTRQCQLILKSVFGMDFSEFVNFLCYIADKRLKQVATSNYVIFDNVYLGVNHIQFDLFRVLDVLESIKKHNMFIDQEINSKFVYNIDNLLRNIYEIQNKSLENITYNCFLF